MEIIHDIKPNQHDSIYLRGLFAEALETMESMGYTLIDLEKNAQLRIQEGKDALVSDVSNFVREGSLYIPGKGRFLVRRSAVLDDPWAATKDHKEGREYTVTNEQAERALEDSIRLPFFKEEIPTNRFGGDDIAVWLFQESAKEYGDFLRDAGISSLDLNLYNEEYIERYMKEPVANQLDFSRLPVKSGICGCTKMTLYFHNSTRGIKKS